MNSYHFKMTIHPNLASGSYPWILVRLFGHPYYFLHRPGLNAVATVIFIQFQVVEQGENTARAVSPLNTALMSWFLMMQRSLIPILSYFP